mgnify:CR=1 FL=1
MISHAISWIFFTLHRAISAAGNSSVERNSEKIDPLINGSEEKNPNFLPDKSLMIGKQIFMIQIHKNQKHIKSQSYD